eukprot:CAMPEP_0116013760 /NCGR_PEP_ID=MMETSP0321-20121206/5906_1 /TAXON_ID=163516 /ORGANISM="Leptocylindrus danicus var. danicus, Strain B650" /LENGTH=854 /DNA_ID=CAMNT_0003483347 /DNA_START=113 /DNA_END=2678 /DNA_ORIENTATION=+
MTTSLRVLSVGSRDFCSPALLLVGPTGRKILVNCGEGCQRAILEYKQSLRSIGHVALCSLNAHYLGGLPGFILTSSDTNTAAINAALEHKAIAAANREKQQRQGKNSKNNNNTRASSTLKTEGNKMHQPLEIIGPIGTKKFVHALRHFMHRGMTKLPINIREGAYLSTDTLNSTVDASKMKKQDTVATGDFGSDLIPFMYEDENDDPISNNDNIGGASESISNSRSQSTQPLGKKARIDDMLSSPSTSTTMKHGNSFLFTTPRIPGKFDAKRAKELGIPRGPLYKELKDGKSVSFELPDGSMKLVHAKEVVAAGSAGISVAVIYCPTNDAFEQLRQSPPLQDLQQSKEDVLAEIRGDNNERVTMECMVHMTPDGIMKSEEYDVWMQSFGPHVQHISLGGSKCFDESPFRSATLDAITRNMIDEDIFPVPCSHDTDGYREEIINEGSDDETCGHLKVIPGRNMMEYVLVPRTKRGLNSSSVRQVISQQEREELKRELSESQALDASSKVHNELNGLCLPGDNDKRQLAELSFTGTGSAIPCKHRNVNGIYMRMNNGNAILLDPGEGTMGQLLRLWTGQKEDESSVQNRICNIRAIWVSHPHADHHLGLIRILCQRNDLCPDDPLILMAPPPIFYFLEEYVELEPRLRGSYVKVSSTDMVHGKINPQIEKLSEDLGLSSCFCVPVSHCQHSYGVVIDGTSFGKVAFSGDCRPSTRLALAAKGANLLIHEATFEDELQEDAVLKRHSTVGEALEVAKKMDADSVVLTHFSQRYPRISKIDESVCGSKSIVFAFDFMMLKPENLKLASKLTESLRMYYTYKFEGKDSDDDKDDASVKNELSSKEILSTPGLFAVKDVL